MAHAAASPILNQLRRMMEDESVRGLSDAELLRAFRTCQEESAFHALVRRHGPMVLDVCRGVLPNEADAEDAFQATFLVLAQKAKSIRTASSLASWLHGVAYRTALKARVKFAQQRNHEARAATRQPAGPEDITWSEVQRVVHEELERLRTCHRDVLVLCFLQGKTQDEAATALGLTPRTLRRRLDEGRALLRARLVRRGFGPTAVLLASAWPTAAAAHLPAALVGPTIQAAAGVAAGQGVAGLVSARVVVLSHAILQTMLLAQVKAVSGFLLALVAGGLLFYGVSAGEQQPQDNAGPIVQARAPLTPRPADPVQALAAVPAAKLPVTWEEDFENGLPPGFERGRFVGEGLPRGSRGAVAALRADRGAEGIHYEIATPKRWIEGLFTAHDDAHFHFTFKMARPNWVNVFIFARGKSPQGPHKGNYLFNDLRFWPPQPDQWQTVSIPFAQFKAAGVTPRPPLSPSEVPYMVLFSSPEDRGLVIDRMWVTRGGPGVVQYQDVQ